MTLRRIVAIIVLGVAALAVLYVIFGDFFRSDASRIERALLQGVAGFNNRRAGAAVSPLAKDFEDQRGVGRGTIRGALAQRFLANRPEDQERVLSVEDFSVEVGESAARSRFELVLTDSATPDARLSAWRARVDATWNEREDEWLIVRVEWNSLEGSPPIR